MSNSSIDSTLAASLGVLGVAGAGIALATSPNSSRKTVSDTVAPAQDQKSTAMNTDTIRDKRTAIVEVQPTVIQQARTEPIELPSAAQEIETQIQATKDAIVPEFATETPSAPKAKETDVSVSPRIAEKIETLRRQLDLTDSALLDKAHPGLREHAERVIKRAELGNAPDFQTAADDAKHLQLMCDAENTRKPGLHLHYIDQVLQRDEHGRATLNEVKKVLEQGAGRYRFIVMPEPGNPSHHLLLDVRKREGDGMISAVLLDSVASSAYQQSVKRGFKREKIPLVIISNGTQKSDVDCAMFSLSHALKAKDSNFVSNLHDTLCEGRDAFAAVDPNDEAGPDEQIMQSRDKIVNLCESEYFVANDKVPTSFKKHMHSKSQLSMLPLQAKERVNGRKHRSPESLSERLDAYYASSLDHKLGGKGSIINSSTSITGFRLKELSRVVDHAAHTPR